MRQAPLPSRGCPAVAMLRMIQNHKHDRQRAGQAFEPLPPCIACHFGPNAGPDFAMPMIRPA